jgi:hypothetical protein
MLLCVGDRTTVVSVVRHFVQNLKGSDHLCLAGRSEGDGFNLPWEDVGMRYCEHCNEFRSSINSRESVVSHLLHGVIT